jgi:putative transposase
MPRPPRIIQPGQPLHLIQRGNNRSVIFAAPADFAYYRRLMMKAANDAQCHIHAFVLMTNHVHFLATPAEASGPSRFMKMVSETYSRYFNHIHARSGTLWEGRYRSTPVDSVHYFFACSRYIELNPVRAAMITRPDDYRWSSFRQNADSAPKDLVTAHPLYRELGPTDHERRLAYRDMFNDTLETATLDAMRYAIAHSIKATGETRRATRAEAIRRTLRGSDAVQGITSV